MATEEVLVALRDSGKRTKRNLRVGVCGAVGRKAGRMTRRTDRVSCVLCIDQGREHQVPMLQRPWRPSRRGLRSSATAGGEITV